MFVGYAVLFSFDIFIHNVHHPEPKLLFLIEEMIGLRIPDFVSVVFDYCIENLRKQTALFHVEFPAASFILSNGTTKDAACQSLDRIRLPVYNGPQHREG